MQKQRRRGLQMLRTFDHGYRVDEVVNYVLSKS